MTELHGINESQRLTGGSNIGIFTNAKSVPMKQANFEVSYEKFNYVQSIAFIASHRAMEGGRFLLVACGTAMHFM